MQPENQNHDPAPNPYIPPTIPAGTPSAFPQPSANPMPQPGSSHKKLILAIIVAAVLLIAGVFVTIVMLAGSPESESASSKDTNAASGADATEPLELTAFSSEQAGFSMRVPKEIEMETEADEVFEGAYTVSGSMGTDLGNRFVTVNKEVYPESLGQSYEDWLKNEIERLNDAMDIAKEDQGTEARLTFGKILSVGDHTGNRMRMEATKTQKDGTRSVTVNEYLLVYISPTVAYTVDLEGKGDDKAFMAVLDEIVQSFALK
jgi:hypothetical protein